VCFNADSTGTYLISAGSLNTSTLGVAEGTNSTGNFIHQAGIVSATSALNIGTGGAGTYSLSGGTLTVPTITLGPGAVLNQSGGALNVGTYVITGASVPPYIFTGGLLDLINSPLIIGSGG